MMDWLRWYQGTVTDPKWRFVASVSGSKVGEVIAVWSCMMEHANKAEPRGSLEGWRDNVYAMLLDIKPETVAAIREAMDTLVLDGTRITAWEKRQQPDSTERVRKFRQRVKRNETDETFHALHETQETRGNAGNGRVEEKRIETDIGRVRAEPEGKVVPLTGKRATQFPADWAPNDEHYVLAKSLPVDADAEAEQFKDHHTARGSTFKDWDAAFRTWLRNGAKFRRNDAPIQSGPTLGGVWG